MNPQPQQQQQPQLRLDFYSTAVLMSRWEEDGRVHTYPVSVHDVVSAGARIELCSGLLPNNTLFWKQRANQMALAIYVPARRWQVQTEDRGYHVPMPPFIFVGNGTAYKIFAVKKRPSSEQTQLYHAPCPNVHTTGSICQGNTPFPPCSSQNIQTALQLFMEGSYFNGDLCVGKCVSFGDDVRVLWDKLNGEKRFPLKELQPMPKTLQSLF